MFIMDPFDYIVTPKDKLSLLVIYILTDSLIHYRPQIIIFSEIGEKNYIDASLFLKPEVQNDKFSCKQNLAAFAGLSNLF